MASGRCRRSWGLFWRGEPPWEGYQLRSEVTRSRVPPQALEVWLPYPLPPLQRITESLIELLLDEAKEGVREGGLLAGLRPQPRTDPVCLLQEEEHLMRCRVYPFVPQ